MKNNFPKIFSWFILVVTLITLGLSIFYNTAFINSFILMLALFIFSIAYAIKDRDKFNNSKNVYILFIIGVILIITSLVYMYLRLKNGR